MTTPDEVFESCERQDRVLRIALGRTLSQATLLIAAIIGVICIIIATVATLV